MLDLPSTTEQKKKAIGGFVWFIFIFFFATLLYTLLAVVVGVLEKVQIAFSLGFVILLAIVYILWMWSRTKLKLP